MFVLFVMLVLLASVASVLRVWKDVRLTTTGVPVVELALLLLFMGVQLGLARIILTTSHRLGW